MRTTFAPRTFCRRLALVSLAVMTLIVIEGVGLVQARADGELRIQIGDSSKTLSEGFLIVSSKVDSGATQSDAFLSASGLKQVWDATVKKESVNLAVVCVGELCVPFDLSRAPAESGVTELQGTLYFSATRFAAALNHKVSWQYVGAEGEILAKSSAESPSSAVDGAAPDFTVTDLDGKPVSLSDFRGKKIFVTAWASW